MVSTRDALESAGNNVEESIGLRKTESRVPLSPVPASKDIGRRPLRAFGRVEIDRVIPDPTQPRCEFSDDAIARLAASIRDKGQLLPIRVRWDREQSKWLIISGERRWRATKEAGLPTVDCYFHDGAVAESEILEQQLIENLLREDLKPIEQGKAFAALMDLNGWNGKQVARALHVTESKVSRALALLDFPEEVQAQIDTGKLAPRTAYEISKLRNGDARDTLTQSALNGKLTHQEATAAVRTRRGKRSLKSRGTKQVFFADDGWKVTVSAPKKGTYHDMEQALTVALEEVRHYIAQGRTTI